MLFQEMEKCLYSFYVSFDLYYKYIVSYIYIRIHILRKPKTNYTEILSLLIFSCINRKSLYPTNRLNW